METTENISEIPQENTGEKPAEKKSNTGVHVFYIILILLLLGGVSFLFMKYNSTSKNLYTCDTAKTRVFNEKAIINQRLDSIENQLMQARTQNDSINDIIKRKLAEIRQLRYRVNALKADNDSLAYYKREIETMRAVALHYTAMIDSLDRANKQLIDANTQLSTQIDEQKKVDQEKTKQIEDLATKVEKASVLKAFNIIAIPLNKKSKPTLKAKRIVKVKVSCTIGENAVVEAGQKTVYIRIVRDDGVCLSSAPENTFQYDNQSILYTEKTDLNYQNQDSNVEIYYNATDDMEGGRYKVNIFIDGKDLGNTEFVLN